MNPSNQEEPGHKNLALWVTVIIEGLMIIAAGAYNIYEIRRSSELVQSKIQGLADYSARQGEKLDRMTTALEIYVGKKFTPDGPMTTNTPTTDQRIEKAIEFLETWKKKDGKAQPDGAANGSQPIRSETNSTSSAAGSRR